MRKFCRYKNLLAFIFLLNFPLAAQTLAELDKKYGPSVGGVYKLGKKISFSVKYGEIGRKMAAYDFERAANLVKTFQRNDVRIAAKLILAQSVFAK